MSRFTPIKWQQFHSKFVVLEFHLPLRLAASERKLSKSLIMNTIVDKTQIASKVKMIFHEKLGVDEANLKPTASLYNDLGLDSLDVIETLMAVEKEFGIKIGDEDTEKLTTFGAVTDYVINRVH
jgi:acyl carrier protein